MQAKTDLKSDRASFRFLVGSPVHCARCTKVTAFMLHQKKKHIKLDVQKCIYPHCLAFPFGY